MNQPAYLHDRWDAQVAFEEEMMETGKERMRDRITKARERHNLGGMRPHRSLLHEWVLPLSEALQKWINTPRRGPKSIALGPLQQLHPDTAAMVALKAVLRMLGMERRNILSIAMEIGTNCEHEARMQHWKESDPKDWQELQARFQARKSTSIHQRRATIAIFNKSKHDELGWLDWTTTERERVGLTMLDLVIESTQRFHIVPDPAWEPYRIKGGAWAQRPAVLMEDNELAEWIANAMDDELLHMPAFAPTLIPPLDWEGPRGGGYHTPFVKSPVLIRFKANHEEQRQVALEEFEALDMPEVYSAVNYVQRSPWAINTRVLEVAETIWDKDLAIAGIIRQEKIDPPDMPEGAIKGTDEYREWAKIASDIHADNATRVSKFLAQRRTLKLARRLADEPEFFFPHHLDFRGRMYSIVSDLSPQGRDLDRGLLTFAKGKPVEEDDEQWLAIHLANVHGVDKENFYDRIKWVKDREARWRQIAADPLDNRLWAEEEDPWQCLAAIFEWVRYLDEGPGMISSLPIRVDGTCNGIQHLSAMVRDEEGGRAVNLVPGNRPRDIYMDVGNIVQQALDDQPLNPFVRMWGRLFGDKVPREVAKRPVMILPYGGTRSAYYRYTLAWLKKHDKDGAVIPRDQRKDALNLLVDLLLKAVKAVVVRAVEVMHWIQHNCAIASRSGKALAWWTPAGFYVRHFYATEEEYRIETKLDGQRLQLRAHRIRKAATTREAAEALEQEIEAALSAYGMWPVPANQDPLAEPLEAYRHADTQEYRQPKHRTGTLREAARIALETHWHGMRSAKSVEPCLWRMVYFLESLGKYDLDLITSADLHAYVKRLREADNSPSFINQQLSHFHVVNEIAHKQTPPLCKIVLSIPREATRIVEKWWLRPEDQDRVSTWLRDPLSSYTDAMFADLIDFICMMEKLPRRYWSDAAAMRNHLMDRILDHARANWDDPKWKRIAYGICYGMGLRKVGGAPFRGRTGTP